MSCQCIKVFCARDYSLFIDMLSGFPHSNLPSSEPVTHVLPRDDPASLHSSSRHTPRRLLQTMLWWLLVTAAVMDDLMDDAISTTAQHKACLDPLSANNSSPLSSITYLSMVTIHNELLIETMTHQQILGNALCRLITVASDYKSLLSSLCLFVLGSIYRYQVVLVFSIPNWTVCCYLNNYLCSRKKLAYFKC